MKNYLDTNYLIRYLTNDIPPLAKTAKKVIEGSKNLYVPPIVLAETVWILENRYSFSKDKILPQLQSILQQQNISSTKFSLLSLKIYKNESIDYYDCLFIAEVLEEKADLKTFDQKMLRVFKKYRNFI